MDGVAGRCTRDGYLYRILKNEQQSTGLNNKEAFGSNPCSLRSGRFELEGKSFNVEIDSYHP